MEPTQKPIPIIEPWTQDFWKGTKQGQLLIQTCDDCHAKIFFPKKYCPECWSKNLSYIPSSGRGKVYTFTVMMDMVEPKFMRDLPYVLAVVELEEGIRMTTRIVHCRPEAVEIGIPVEVVFEDISADFALPVFHPVDVGIRLVEADPKGDQIELKPAGALKPSDYRTILYEISGKNGAVCTITLNRPEKFNAINRIMAAELIDAFRRVRDERSVAVVVLTGAGGKAFCTGGDLEIFPSLAEHQAGLNWLAHEGLDVQRSIGSCEKIVICKINGHCLAGGLELALACDLLYAKASAKMGATEINMGILPGWGGTARLPRSMPVFRAREIVLSGRKDYKAREMYEMGLLTRVFEDEAFEAEFAAILANLASKKPNALRMAKEIMARSVDGCDLETALALERSGIQWLSHAPEIRAMMDQFRAEPKQLTQHQKEQNVRTDQGKR